MTQLDRIERYTLLAAKNVLTVEDASILMGLSPSTIHKMTMRHILPFYKPNGKNIFFSRKELEEWMLQNRCAAEDEVASVAAGVNFNIQ